MSRLLVVLSPAKNLDFAAPARKCLQDTVPKLVSGADFLVDGVLRGQTSGQLGKTLGGLSATLSKLNHNRYQQFKVGADRPVHPDTEDQSAAQAITAYNGRAWKGLDQASLSDKEMVYCGKTLRIISGLYGLLRPSDVIQPYRLDFGTKLSVGDKHKNLYSYWGSRVRDALIEEKPDVVVNAASGEYWKGVGESALRESGVKVITVSFREGVGNGARVIAVHAKLARGMFVRFMCEHACSSVESLKAFNGANYRFNEKLSSDDEFVFTRSSAPKKKPQKRRAAAAKGVVSGKKKRKR